MSQSITFSKTLTAKKHYDVIVAGGGVAGVAAAVSSAKYGRSVLLLEKSNILGGLATLGLVNLFVPMCNGRGKHSSSDLPKSGCATLPCTALTQFPSLGKTVNRQSRPVCGTVSGIPRISLPCR